MPARPPIETIVSITDHVLVVFFMVNLKYSLNIRKPGSFTPARELQTTCLSSLALKINKKTICVS